ncbi:cobalamin biosynthesis protein [Prescottella agglutinans]|uniref:Cobalamin biosynthesis protein CobD n=1 Tax=Prescottella agglutinans TaxID=1644129 RepID=A0ABT6M5L2_9NOCA|nr:cobalamin biosynthesis protein [Prescottella agglutinans]MDH6279565.1 adenosylcobinamide-phosphate synthase [Prescottella agglutinans]
MFRCARRVPARRSRSTARAAGLLLGYAADRVVGDPRRWHPVAGFGLAAMGLEQRTYADSRLSGAVHTAVLVGATAAGGVVAHRLGARLGWFGETTVTAAATWTVLGGTSLAGTGRTMARHLEAGDLESARALLPSLCGRDPSVLSADGLARASLESVAENTSDATVGALFWGAVAGVPGLLAYRASNTLDAMIGYRSPKYSRFGWAAARWDDLVNLAPARLTGALTVAVAPVVGGSARGALDAWRRDASKHPSPNAGVAEASAAGALGVQLGGRTEYAHGVEMRPTLGTGPAPVVADLERAARLSSAVQVGAAVAAAALTLAAARLRQR